MMSALDFSFPTSKMIGCRTGFVLITKHVALKVDQEDETFILKASWNLGVRSNASWLLTVKKHGLSLPGLSRFQIHVNMQTAIKCMCV